MQKKKLVILLIVSIFAGLASSFFASPYPDGLEKVAENHGFTDNAINFWNGFMPDYTFLGIENKWLATGLAGLIGTIATFLVLYGALFIFVKVRK